MLLVGVGVEQGWWLDFKRRCWCFVRLYFNVTSFLSKSDFFRLWRLHQQLLRMLLVGVDLEQGWWLDFMRRCWCFCAVKFSRNRNSVKIWPFKLVASSPTIIEDVVGGSWPWTRLRVRFQESSLLIYRSQWNTNNGELIGKFEDVVGGSWRWTRLTVRFQGWSSLIDSNRWNTNNGESAGHCD